MKFKDAYFNSLLLLGFFLHVDNLIMTHSRQHSNHVGFATVEVVLNLTSKVIGIFRELNILTARSIFVHQSDKSISRDIDKRIFLANDEGNMSSVGGRNDIFVLLSGEDVNSSEVALSVSVLSSLGSRDRRNLARMLLNANVTIQQKRKAIKTFNQSRNNPQKKKKFELTLLHGFDQLLRYKYEKLRHLLERNHNHQH